jgi:hypothetical protein
MSAIQAAIRIPLEIIVSHTLRFLPGVVSSDPDTRTTIEEDRLKVFLTDRIQQKLSKTKHIHGNTEISPEQVITEVCRTTMECLQTPNNIQLIDQQITQHTDEQTGELHVLSRMQQEMIRVQVPRQYISVHSDEGWIHELFTVLWNAICYSLVKEIVIVFRHHQVIRRDDTSPLVRNTMDAMIELLQFCLGIEESENT